MKKSKSMEKNIVKIECFLLTIMLIIASFGSFTACGKQESQHPNETPNPTVFSGDSGEETGAPGKPTSMVTEEPVSSVNVNKLFFCSDKPVAASCDRFIVKNNNNNYGLVDKAGNYIMPCEYGDMSFKKTKSGTVVMAMSKGSYGVFDLNGNMLIDCAYSSISFSKYFDCCIVRNYRNKLGSIGLDNHIIVPLEYDYASFNGESLQGIDIELYNSVMFQKNYDSQYTLFSLSGEKLIYGNNNLVESVVLGDYIVYIYQCDGKTYARNTKTGKDQLIWQCPLTLENGRLSYSYNKPYTNFYGELMYIDPVTGVMHYRVSIDSGIENIIGSTVYTSTSYTLDICLVNDSIICIDVSNQLGASSKRISRFCDNKICVLRNMSIETWYGFIPTSNDTIVSIRDINNPFSNVDNCGFLYNSLILYNNGYYSIIDYEGNELISDKGFSMIEKTFVSELALLTDNNGNKGIINGYTEVIIPCGDHSISVVEPKNNDEYGIEAQNYLSRYYRIIVCDGEWALYSGIEHKLITDFVSTEGLDSAFYNCFSNRRGYVLQNEEISEVYMIGHSEDGYSVSVVVG